MTVWELRRLIEDSMPWWASLALGVGMFAVLIGGRWLFDAYGNSTTGRIERKLKR